MAAARPILPPKCPPKYGSPPRSFALGDAGNAHRRVGPLRATDFGLATSVDQTDVGNGCPEAFDESNPPEFWPGPLDCAALIEDGRAESRRPRRSRTNRDAQHLAVFRFLPT